MADPSSESPVFCVPHSFLVQVFPLTRMIHRSFIMGSIQTTVPLRRQVSWTDTFPETPFSTPLPFRPLPEKI